MYHASVGNLEHVSCSERTVAEQTARVASPIVELSFKVHGKAIPIDHGYGLYSAISHKFSQVHAIAQGLSVQNINGFIDAHQSVIRINETSQLKIRTETQQIPLIYPLANKQLYIGKHEIRLGIPEISFIIPFPNLHSRITVIKGHREPEGFLQAAQRQVDKLEISGELRLAAKTEGSPKRKTIKIKRHTVVGFGLEILNLSDDDSLILQSFGVGGKHKMGCGIFVPTFRSAYGPNS